MTERLNYLLKKRNEFHSRYPNEKLVFVYIAPFQIELRDLFRKILIESDPPTFTEFEKLVNIGLGVAILQSHFEENTPLDLFVVSNDAFGLQINGSLRDYVLSKPDMNFEF